MIPLWRFAAPCVAVGNIIPKAFTALPRLSFATFTQHYARICGCATAQDGNIRPGALKFRWTSNAWRPAGDGAAAAEV